MQSTERYLITEPYDGSHVRILADGASPEDAERQMDAERATRRAKGYSFFRPIRRILGDPAEVDNELDRRITDFPTWEAE